MKPIRLLLSDARRHRGLALIIVLSMLALATIVILAFLSVAETENKATNIYSASQASRRFADTAVNLVISQLREGAARETAGVPVIHATQPGAIRKYNSGGNFMAGYKLFSDQDMVFRSRGDSTSASDEERFVTESEPPADWNQAAENGRYVDLNEPVVKGVANAAKTNSGTQVFFPVIDPRAGINMDASGGEVPIEGFSYDAETAMTKANIGRAGVSSSSNAILTPKDGGADQLRLAMPVQWLYILRDGAVGYLDNQRIFRVLDNAVGFGDGPSVTTGDSYGVPSTDNPMVGRVAFWADDESCKVNINTASEPTYAGLPIYYHERDHLWADCPPTRGEYQRFPGHPATVALSSVFYPNPLMDDRRSLDTYTLRGIAGTDDLSRAKGVKDLIYNLAPRIHNGGSNAGTTPFSQDSFRGGYGDTNISDYVKVRDAAAERLYASVDELLFDQGDNNKRRVLNPTQGGGVNLFNKATLERASAFITAHSRASEINLYGLPRVAMWPVATTSNRRTPFDELVVFCSRLGGDIPRPNIYVFQREQSRYSGGRSAVSHDISLPRNDELLNMLDRILQHPFPTSSERKGASGRSFQSRMGDDARQILVSMFDFIRSTNVYDGFLAPARKDLPTGDVGNWSAMYKTRDRVEGDFKTFTVGPMVGNLTDPFSDRTMPGHGQVTPSMHLKWKSSNGKPMKGFGRFISISEVGLHFICTADGQPDMYSWRLPVRDPAADTDSTKKGNYLIPVLQAGEMEAKALGVAPVVSGGRTALRVDENPLLERIQIVHDAPNGFVSESARLMNTEQVRWRTPSSALQQTSEGQIKDRYYSNFPPLTEPNVAGFYNTTSLGTSSSPGDKNYGRYFRNHPGYNPSNWNYTLRPNEPLPVTKKRIQALLHFEFFCPSVAYPEIHPDFTVVISGQDMSNITINGNALFNSTKSVALRSERPLFSVDDHPETGGFASFRNAAIGRRAGPKAPMKPDANYNTDTGGQVHEGLINMDLISSFFDLDRNQSLTFQPSLLKLKIYDHHVDADTTEEPIQVISVNIESGEAPAPDIVTAGSYAIDYTRDDGVRIYHPAIQAPRWWSFSYDGCVGRVGDNPAPSSLRGRFFRWDGSPSISNSTRAVDPRKAATDNQSLPGAYALIYGKDGGNYVDVEQITRRLLEQVNSTGDQQGARVGYGPSTIGSYTPRHPDGNFNRPWHFGTDTVRSLVPSSGDARMIAAKFEVETRDWMAHRLWRDNEQYMAHNFSSYTAGTEPGFDRGKPLTNSDSDSVDLSVRGLPAKVILDGSNPTGKGAGRTPDLPATQAAAIAMQRYGDFDDSDPGGRVGPFINKVDEGNYSVGDFKFQNNTITKKWRSTYFRRDFGARYASGSNGFFTPNRMVASPLVMGSLPSRVWQNDGAWTNLLFRPHVQYETNITGGVGSSRTHPGQETPPDHYLADLFWMPVVEPYAISETLSTAGKVNMNYQILPFTHIRRATALHAAMKGELMAAIPNVDYENSKNTAVGWGTNASREPRFYSERDNKVWHRGIVVDSFGKEQSPWWSVAVQNRVQGTLRQFEERFTFGKGATVSSNDGSRGGLFRTTSQLCEMHLIPTSVNGRSADANPSESAVRNATERTQAMARFWSEHAATGDNTRERPYSNLYGKLTTRSNTFRVHVRAQSIRKASRSVAANVFDPDIDQVGGEFRGSFLIERYLDQTDLRAAERSTIDYAAAQNPFALKPLENYYRFRILESKRFAP